MTATALDRLERVLVMVPWLLEHQGATFQEIADRFDATPEEVAADLDTLGYCGLPGYGGGDLVEVTAVGDTVTVRMADFFRRPLRLSLREAITLLLAARSLLQVEGLPESRALRRALQRLEDLLGASAPLDPERVRIAIDLKSEGDEYLAPLRQAIRRGRVVHITYRSASKAEVTRREVEPWSVVGAGGVWYLRGHCRVAGGHRDFRLDRIAELEVLATPVAHRSDQAIGEAPRYVPSPEDETIVIDLAQPAWWLVDDLVADDVQQEGAWRTVTLRARELEWLARRLVGIGQAARVRRPDALARRVEELAVQLRARYGDDSS